MRPVNLIPAEERRAGARTGRTGPAPYLLIGAMVAILAGVTALVMTSNSISESEAEITRLEAEEQAARARADSLRSFADFSSAQATRTATVSTLAQSRFDWERVLNELAVVIPSGITLKTLTGTVNPSVSLQGESDVGLRDEIPGPALSMTGCAPGQEAVAALIAALEDIDGVTRVGLDSSISEGSGGSSDTGGCFGGTTFGLVVAFDEVVVPTATTPAAPAAPPASDDAAVADAAQQQADAASSVQDSAETAESAVTSTAGQ